MLYWLEPSHCAVLLDMFASVTEISQRTTRHTDMVIESMHDIGLDYAQTLAHWREKFLAYYFGYCEGAFLERATSTVHVVMRKH